MPTASGKTFAGMLTMLYAIIGDCTSGPRFASSVDAKGIWEAHDKVLVTQVFEDMLSAISSNIFGFMHFTKAGKKSTTKASQLVNIAMGYIRRVSSILSLFLMILYTQFMEKM